MATLHNTIPADESAPLAKKQAEPTSLKRLVAGAAVASFVLGLLAATAITSATPQMASLKSQQEDCNTGSTGYEWCDKKKKCLQPWTVDDWKKTCNGKPKQSCWLDTSGSYRGCEDEKKNTQCSGAPKWKCQKPNDPICNKYCQGDSDCALMGGKTKCGECVPYGDGVRKWCQKPEKDQCTKECKTTYDCSNKNGKWDKGCPWMGSKCEGGFCKKTYQKCKSNSDCDTSKSKCGPKGYCVGK